jgi:NAD(P)H dehydrogenase (quinone)
MHSVSMSDNALQYSMYGHMKTLAEAEKKGVESAGGKVDVYQ